MSDVRFASWSAPESPVTIEYSLVVIEEIRQEVAEGFQRLSRGGVEVGGVLYGSREGRTVRILAMRPINCEHARGPAFLLSDTDRQALEDQLKHELEDPRLSGMICLGWFCSHTRSEIALPEADQQIYEAYFSAPWQVTLVIRPGRGGSMRAGFFVREHDGTVRCESSYLEFNFPDRLAGVLDRPARAERPGSSRPHTVYFREGGPTPARRELTVAAPAPAMPAPIEGPKLLPAPPPRSKWPWLIGWGVVVVIGIIFGLRYFVVRPVSEPLSLSVAERNGQLQIAWNKLAKPVESATRGTLTITEGQNPLTFVLTPQALAQGTFNYERTTDDVEIQLTLDEPGGAKAEEATTFLGATPTKADSDTNVKAVEKERDELKQEVETLKRQNAEQTDRIQQLERNLKVLQSRLGIE